GGGSRAAGCPSRPRTRRKAGEQPFRHGTFVLKRKGRLCRRLAPGFVPSRHCTLPVCEDILLDVFRSPVPFQGATNDVEEGNGQGDEQEGRPFRERGPEKQGDQEGRQECRGVGPLAAEEERQEVT